MLNRIKKARRKARAAKEAKNKQLEVEWPQRCKENQVATKKEEIEQKFIDEEHYELSREYHEYYQRAISLNNTGVYHFESGNYDQARVLFRDALKALRESTMAAARCSTYCEEHRHHQKSNDDKIPEFITMTDDSEGSSDSHNTYLSNNKYDSNNIDDSNEEVQIQLKWSKRAPLHSELLLNIMPPEAAATTQGNIFSRALFLIDMNNQDNQQILFQEDMGANESKGIIYNMALSYLYLAIQKGSPGLLKKARQLFSKIIQLQPSPPTRSSGKFDGGYNGSDFYPMGCEAFSKGTADTVTSSVEFEFETTPNPVECSDKFWSNFRLPKASYSKIFNRMEKMVRPQTKVLAERRYPNRHEMLLTLS